ncbi:DUF4288 domain-containing protein [Nocardia sp. NBC_00403]|uniref:DUF4288 domain-containing protein n=1 Tax=Nocardia sp. NBC_00403 TaxID=2975990 RepID=UPI002E237EDC
MRMTYDPAADAAYCHIADSIAPGAAAQRVVTAIERGTVVLDISASGTLLGLEVLGAQQVLPPEALERTRTSPYVAVALYKSTSDAPDYRPLYEECFILVFADSVESARTAARTKAEDQEARYRNERGDTVTWSLEHLVDVAPAVDDNLETGGTFYSRHFRDYDAYRRMEPLLDGDPL